MASPSTSVPPAPAPGLQRHVPALDGLRGLAILLVIPHNADAFSAAASFMWPAAMVAHAGWVGVQLFFVLSGFLITSNLLDSQQSANYYSSFFARRILRIFPLYYGVLFVGLVILPHLVTLSPQASATHSHQIWLWTFLVNWFQPFGKGTYGFPHFWSLAIEEQFYLLWPFLIHRRTPRAVWKLCAGIIIAAFAIRAGMLAAGAKSEMLYMFTVSRMDALAAGAACAALLRAPAANALLRRYESRYWIIGCALAAAALAITRVFEIYAVTTFTIGYPLISAAFAFLLLAALAPASGFTSIYQSVLNFAPLRAVGKYSFAMYVFHMPLQLAVGPRVLPALQSTSVLYPLLYPLLITLLSFVAAFASYHLYEKHFLKLKRHFEPDRTMPPTSAALKQISQP